MPVIAISPNDRKTLAGWMGMSNCRLSLLYSATRDGWAPGAFLLRCANRCPLLVVSGTVSGYVFGGYTDMPFAKDGTAISAPGSFLFRLKKDNALDYMKFEALDSTTSVAATKTEGPTFRNATGPALRFFSTNVTSNPGQNFVTSTDLVTDFSKGYKANGQDANALNGGDKKLLNVEVYAVEEAHLYTEGNEWRHGLDFTKEMLAGLKDDILKLEPPKKLFIPKVNILFMGRVGAGKSSFYNTLNSSFQGHVTVKAPSGSRGHSVTTKYRQYELRPSRGQRALRVRLCDTMGLEEGKDQGININDVPYILDGNITDGFQFTPTAFVTPKHPDFNAMPKDKDAIHVVALMVEATAVSTSSLSTDIIEKQRNVIAQAYERGIPVAVLLTKIDEVCADVSRDLSLVYRSVRVQECVEAIAEKLGVIRSCVLPVMNYHTDHVLKQAVDILALFTLRQLTRMADDLFDDMMERKGLYEEEQKKHTK